MTSFQDVWHGKGDKGVKVTTVERPNWQHLSQVLRVKQACHVDSMYLQVGVAFYLFGLLSKTPQPQCSPRRSIRQLPVEGQYWELSRSWKMREVWEPQPRETKETSRPNMSPAYTIWTEKGCQVKSPIEVCTLVMDRYWFINCNMINGEKLGVGHMATQYNLIFSVNPSVRK